jgi:hypothetical protein
MGVQRHLLRYFIESGNISDLVGQSGGFQERAETAIASQSYEKTAAMSSIEGTLSYFVGAFPHF